MRYAATCLVVLLGCGSSPAPDPTTKGRSDVDDGCTLSAERRQQVEKAKAAFEQANPAVVVTLDDKVAAVSFLEGDVSLEVEGEANCQTVVDAVLRMAAANEALFRFGKGWVKLGPCSTPQFNLFDIQVSFQRGNESMFASYDVKEKVLDQFIANYRPTDATCTK